MNTAMQEFEKMSFTEQYKELSRCKGITAFNPNTCASYQRHLADLPHITETMCRACTYKFEYKSMPDVADLKILHAKIKAGKKARHMCEPCEDIPPNPNGPFLLDAMYYRATKGHEDGFTEQQLDDFFEKYLEADPKPDFSGYIPFQEGGDRESLKALFFMFFEDKK